MLIKQNTNTQLRTSADVAKIMQGILKSETPIEQEKEYFWTIGLDATGRVKYIDLVHIGTLTHTTVHPREIFRMAVHQGCAAVICVHNHPSGDSTPSKPDIKQTQQLKRAGRILGIELMDHIIITLAESLSIFSQLRRNPNAKN